MKELAKIKVTIERLSPADRQELAKWIGARITADGEPKTNAPRQAKANPLALNRKLLPGFTFKRIPSGWKGQFPGKPLLFGKPVLLIAETEEAPDFSKLPRALSPLQAELVQKVASGLPGILRMAKKEVEHIGLEPDEEGEPVPLSIYVWLHCKNDDGKSWEFVVEKADGSGFGYHLAYQGTKFCETWAGD